MIAYKVNRLIINRFILSGIANHKRTLLLRSEQVERTNPNFNKLVHRMNRLHVLHRLYINQAAIGNGLYFGQLPILELVDEHDGCTQKELADLLQVTAPAVATSVKRLQRHGLLQKIADEEDLRCNRISITEKGRQQARRVREAFDAVDARMFKGFSEEDCADFCAYFDRAIGNLAVGEYQGRSFFSLLEQSKQEQAHHHRTREESLSD
ncbi:MAG: MarR family transcriptional regulator [Clostridiales bacterium]|nr:MAG: MarR family transcriptional regulator [Clostridiales bacterium]RGB69987.1 MarR family transcriptional regulator [Harryflintia acetispora]